MPLRIVLFSLAASVSGCFCADTCSPGTTFESVALVGDPAPDAGVISITFTKGTAKLPDGYYAVGAPLAANALSEPPDGGWVDASKATFIAPDRFDVVLPRPVGDAAKFGLEFPDRRGFLQCSHPGAGDSYRLELSFDRAASPSLSWKQAVRLGPI